MTPLSLPLLANKIGHACALFKEAANGKRSSVDVDAETTRQVQALLSTLARPITCISSIPLIDAEGRLIQRAGLDEASGNYLDIEPGAFDQVAIEPTHTQTVEALRRAWHPWSAYRWATPHDRAAALGALLLVPLRPTIAAAPGFISTAAAEGAGKSKCVEALAALVVGNIPPALSFPKVEEEAKKLLVSLLREGAAAVIFDNLKGTVDSEVLATIIYSGQLRGRVLGISATIEGDARTLWLASGNSVSLSRDLARRFTTAVIDPGTDKPQELSFPFDPPLSALADRLGIVVALLTLHRAWHAAGRLGYDGKGCGFQVWACTIRAMVRWLHDSGIAAEAGIGELGDPAHGILTLEAAKSDPTAQQDAAIVLGLYGRFGSAPFRTGEAQTLFVEGRRLAERGITADDPDLNDASAVMFFEGVVAAKPESMRMPQGISTQSLSTILRFRRGRRIGKLRIELMAETARDKTWRIVSD